MSTRWSLGLLIFLICTFGSTLSAIHPADELWAPHPKSVERESPDGNWKVVQSKRRDQWILTTVPIGSDVKSSPPRGQLTAKGFEIARDASVIQATVTDFGSVAWVEYSSGGRRMALYVADDGENPPQLVKEYTRQITSGSSRTKNGRWLPFGFPDNYVAVAVPKKNEVVFALGEFCAENPSETSLVDCFVLRRVNVDTGESSVVWSTPRIGKPIQFSRAGSKGGLMVARTSSRSDSGQWSWKVLAWDTTSAEMPIVESELFDARGPISVVSGESRFQLKVLDADGALVQQLKWQDKRTADGQPALVPLNRAAKKETPFQTASSARRVDAPFVWAVPPLRKWLVSPAQSSPNVLPTYTPWFHSGLPALNGRVVQSGCCRIAVLSLPSCWRAQDKPARAPAIRSAITASSSSSASSKSLARSSRLPCFNSTIRASSSNRIARGRPPSGAFRLV